MGIAHDLRHGDLETLRTKYRQIAKNNIHIICDNLQDTFSLGSCFRLADQLGAKEVILTGDCELPFNKQVKKSSVYLSDLVSWSYISTAEKAIEIIKPIVDQVVALEITAESKSYETLEYLDSIAIVIGNESKGVSTEALSLVDACVSIPQYGLNHSMNVIMALGIFGNHYLLNKS